MKDKKHPAPNKIDTRVFGDEVNRRAPFMATPEPGTELVLTPFPNGGWTVRQANEMHVVPTPLGSYTTAHDLVEALNDALCVTTDD